MMIPCYYSTELKEVNRNLTVEISSEWLTAVHFSSYLLSVLTCVLGIMSNIVVIYIAGFILKERLSMIWFQNLAIADLLYLMFSPLNIVFALKRKWLFGSFVCKLYHFFSSTHTYATIFTITFLNVYCTWQVAKPQTFISRRSCYYACAVIWIITIVSSLPAIFYTDEHMFGETKQCILFHYDLFNYKYVLNTYYDRLLSEMFHQPRDEEASGSTDEPAEGTGFMLYNETGTFDNISHLIWTSVPNVTSYDILKIASTAAQNIASSNTTNFTSIYVLKGSSTNLFRTTSTVNNCWIRQSYALFQEIWNEMMFSTRCLVIPLLVIGYIIPLCVIITFSLIVALKVRTSPNGKSFRLYRITVALVLVFFITRTPAVIAQIIFLVSAQYENVEVMVDIMNILPVLSSLAHVSSCLNPIVYVMLGKQILNILKGSSGSGIL